MDPTPGDEDAVFIHPPFTDFPDAHKYKDGLSYNVLATHPNWFLDPLDYQTVNNGNPTAIKYPQQLEPPRGWCPAKKKELKDGWPEGEEPRLRCTFCRRTYAGVNAKSMWRRHVFEKHKIAMSNRRADAAERKGRGSNKENGSTIDGSRSSGFGSVRGAAKAELEVEAERRASSSRAKPRSYAGGWAKPAFARTRSLPVTQLDDSEDELEAEEVEDSLSCLLPPLVPAEISGSSSALDPDSDVFNISGASSTPPLTPGMSPSSSTSRRRDLVKIMPESPYDPFLTPAFRHSPSRLPIDQPWRFPSPSHPLHAAKDLSLSMLACGEASPIVRGLDVSPVVLLPPSERSKRSIFSSPIFMTKKDGSSPDLDAILRGKEIAKASPRRLLSETGLPTPFNDRLESLKRYRVPESPLGRAWTPRKSQGPSLRKGAGLWRSILSPSKSPTKAPAASLLGPIELEGEDPFADGTFKSFLASPALEDRAESPPDSSPECESPVVRMSQLGPSLSQDSSADDHDSSVSTDADGSFGLGIGLLEGFSLRESSSSKFTLDDLLTSTPKDREPSRREAKRSRVHSTLNSSPLAAHPPKKPRREFLMDAVLDGDRDIDMNEVFHSKKRRRTITVRE